MTPTVHAKQTAIVRMLTKSVLVLTYCLISQHQRRNTATWLHTRMSRRALWSMTSPLHQGVHTHYGPGRLLYSFSCQYNIL
jgi:hypothetical protein